jgi:hypothetical protein
MFGIRNATLAVTESAEAVKSLSNSAEGELFALSAQVKQGAELVPILVLVLLGSAVLSAIAVGFSLVAIARD